MRKIDTQQLKEGMVLARTLYTDNGIILIKKETKLVSKYIDKIIKTGYDFVYIEDELSEGIEVIDVVEELVVKKVKNLVKQSIGKIKNGQFKVGEEVQNHIEIILDQVLEDKQTLISIQQIHNKGEYLLLHSINVCVLSLVMGKKLFLSEEQLKTLATGAILHDVGKTELKFSCNRYHDDYTEDERRIYVTHVEKGYEIAKKISSYGIQMANIVRTHHEKFDGTGFPYKLKGDSIHILARIVAVANEYDNLLNNPPVNIKMKNHEIIEYITSKSYRDFDPEIVKILRATIAPFPISAGVILSDGRMGIVTNQNPHFPTKPVIRILDKDTKKPLDEVDLSKSLSVLVEDEIDIDKYFNS